MCWELEGEQTKEAALLEPGAELQLCRCAAQVTGYLS